MNVFRTLMVPAAQGPLAVKITDALGYPDRGMFVTEVEDGAVIGYISTGIVDDASPVLADAATLHAACAADPSITLADCESLVRALDLTPDEPFGRMEFVKQEIALGATAVPWVQPTGAADAYAKDAVVSHSGQAWRSMIDANVWAPGVSGWRLLWATTTAAPDWVQPTGQHDAYKIGDVVTYQGQTWECIAGDANGLNVWAPGVYGWKVVS